MNIPTYCGECDHRDENFYYIIIEVEDENPLIHNTEYSFHGILIDPIGYENKTVSAIQKPKEVSNIEEMQEGFFRKIMKLFS